MLVNEDFPSLATSSRNACLDAVDSSDIYIGIVGERGGWRTPSGRLVVEEEYDEARTRKLPVLVFLQNVSRDADAEQFSRELSDYVDGAFRVTFQTPEELESAVEKALEPLITVVRMPIMNHSTLQATLQDPHSILNQTSLRYSIAPEREEEVFDPVTLNSREFRDQVFRLGHANGVELFSYQKSKEGRIDGNSLVVHQEDSYSRGNSIDEVRLQVMEVGLLIIDSNVTGKVLRGHQYSMLGGFVIAEEDIEARLKANFHFVGSLFDEIDTFRRHQRFLYNVALTGVERRKLERDPQERTTYSPRFAPLSRPVFAYEEARTIDRSDLTNPEMEINRILAVLSRQLENQ